MKKSGQIFVRAEVGPTCGREVPHNLWTGEELRGTGEALLRGYFIKSALIMGKARPHTPHVFDHPLVSQTPYRIIMHSDRTRSRSVGGGLALLSLV